jgi:uncharacterized membrane protein YhaH (DUF805 family)
MADNSLSHRVNHCGGSLMDWVRRNFQPSGRTSRVGYWRYQIGSMLVCAVLILLTVILSNTGGPSVLPFVLIIPLVLALLLIAVRRLHDRNRSAWWLLPFVFGPFSILVAANYFIKQGGGAVLVALPLSLLAMALNLWGWIEMGFLAGTRGPNRYGPEPIR